MENRNNAQENQDGGAGVGGEENCVSAALARAILETIDAPIVILDREGEIVRFNRACETLTGYAAEEAVGRKVWDFLIIDEEIEPVRAYFRRTGTAGAPTHFTNHWKTKDGGRRLIEWTNTKILSRDGNYDYFLSTGVDITESRLKDRALYESWAFLQAIIDASPIAIVTSDETGRIMSFSREAEKTFRAAESEMLGKNFHLLLPADDRAGHDRCMRRYLETGAEEIVGVAREVTGLRCDGETFPAILQISEFTEGGRIFVGFIEDITDRKNTERRLSETQAQLQHTGRLAAMGEIAASIAHELNQPLTAAASLAGAVSLRLTKSPARTDHKESAEMLDDIVSEVRRASAIIRQMRDFVRKRSAARSLQDVNRLVEEAATIAFIGNQGDNADLQLKLGADAGEAMVDPIQIQQVIINLIRNAVDAMRDAPKKTLTISTGRKDDLIEIIVTDTGPGIPHNLKDRLFDPFVTNKEDGMGIGLSISKSIVDAHNGTIAARNGDDDGSVFTVQLPAGWSDSDTLIP